MNNWLFTSLSNWEKQHLWCFECYTWTWTTDQGVLVNGLHYTNDFEILHPV